MRKILIASCLLAAVAAAPLGASASDVNLPVNVPKDQWLSVEQIAAKFKADGYDVRKVEIDDGVYEVYAIDAKGMRLEAHVHPATGEILKSGQDD
ncbi:PepSY domain-containing protein [Microvirga tunisiensis]|uniref:PepSY domain-containing protein n=2 Tax=Pannonibacter tanglangensis TaxID=2750084 RepID=A0ABW9ZFW1_9HYPH|nr:MULTISPECIES: PepSY domain-containing protein [unclassified Pannonibacter]NBN62938.1 PepSY domain-containing protein [Pannonibacter sp. XCT-34]NBN78510.1 PepSY domain-containing protein [Pannonibacter sp. XCT-53]